MDIDLGNSTTSTNDLFTYYSSLYSILSKDIPTLNFETPYPVGSPYLSQQYPNENQYAEHRNALDYIDLDPNKTSGTNSRQYAEGEDEAWDNDRCLSHCYNGTSTLNISDEAKYSKNHLDSIEVLEKEKSEVDRKDTPPSEVKHLWPSISQNSVTPFCTSKNKTEEREPSQMRQVGLLPQLSRALNKKKKGIGKQDKPVKVEIRDRQKSKRYYHRRKAQVAAMLELYAKIDAWSVCYGSFLKINPENEGDRASTRLHNEDSSIDLHNPRKGNGNQMQYDIEVMQIKTIAKFALEVREILIRQPLSSISFLFKSLGSKHEGESIEKTMMPFSIESSRSSDVYNLDALQKAVKIWLDCASYWNDLISAERRLENKSRTRSINQLLHCLSNIFRWYDPSLPLQDLQLQKCL